MTVHFRRHAQFPFDTVGQQAVIAVRDSNHGLPAWPQNSLHLREKGLILFQVLKHIDGDGAVELPVRQSKIVILQGQDRLIQ